MATARAHREEMHPSRKEILSIRDDLYSHWEKMKKQESYCPTVQELDKYAEKIIKFIDKNHKEVDKTKSLLKDAIIDLTEIPLMHPQMQRLAIHTALRDACENIDKFCSKTY